MSAEKEMQTAVMLAQASYRKDAMFRRLVDYAAAEAMRHADHLPDGEIEPRDLHHIAVSAAMAALRLAIDGDNMLKMMEAERDAYKERAERGLSLTSMNLATFPKP